MTRCLAFSSRPPRWPLLLLLLILMLYGVLALDWRTQSEEQTRVEALAAKVKARQQNIARQTIPQATAVDPGIQPLLQALQAAWRADIALLRLDAQASERRISLSVRARSQTALLDFATRLRQTGLNVRLQQQEILPQEQANGLNGVVTATLEVWA